MRINENWLKAYLDYTQQSESPDNFHFWTGVATIAGALRRRVWIDQLQFQWTPNFYIVLVGPPGVAAKSTSIRAGLSLLEQVPGIFFGPQSMTWQALTEALANAQEHVEIPPLLEAEVMSCLTIGISELGTFLRPDNAELVDVLIAMWDGQKEVWRRQTKTQGETTIFNPWLNVIGCTTPAWLKQNFPDVLVGGGLTSRIIFVYGDKKRRLIAYPSSVIPSQHYKQKAEELIKDLTIISQLSGEYKLSTSAEAFGVAWYEEHWSRATSNFLNSERFAGYFSRKQTHLHKLAIIFAAAKRDKLIIEEEDLIDAHLALKTIEQDMQKVFASIGTTDPKAEKAEKLRQLVTAYTKITNQDLWKLCFNIMSTQDYVEAIKANIDAGYIRLTVENGNKILNSVSYS